MRRYRNARYAPESLERKLSPSGMGVSPAPAQYGAVSTDPGPAPSNYSSDDYLATDGDGDGDDDGNPPLPGEGPAPNIPPQNPTSPVLPG